MQQFTLEVVAIVESNGGSMTYRALYDAVAAEKRPLLRKAILEAKSYGVLKQKVEHAPDGSGNVHTVEKVG